MNTYSLPEFQLPTTALLYGIAGTPEPDFIGQLSNQDRALMISDLETVLRHTMDRFDGGLHQNHDRLACTHALLLLGYLEAAESAPTIIAFFRHSMAFSEWAMDTMDNAPKYWFVLLLVNAPHALDDLILDAAAFDYARELAVASIGLWGHLQTERLPELEIHLQGLMEQLTAPGRIDAGLEEVLSALLVEVVNLRFKHTFEAMAAFAKKGFIESTLRRNWKMLSMEVNEPLGAMDPKEFHQGDLAGLYANTKWAFPME